MNNKNSAYYTSIVDSKVTAKDLAKAVEAERSSQATRKAKRIVSRLDEANEQRDQAKRELKQAAKRLKKYEKALEKFAKTGKDSALNIFG